MYEFLIIKAAKNEGADPWVQLREQWKDHCPQTISTEAAFYLYQKQKPSYESLSAIKYYQSEYTSSATQGYKH